MEDLVAVVDDDFYKYPSLINYLHEKEIAWWLEKFPKINEIPFCVREKLDGANIQLYFLPDGTIKKGRRTSWLQSDEKFYDIDGAMSDNPEFIEYFSLYAKTHNKPVRVFCELHGKGINKRVYYGEKIYLTVLDIIYGDQWATQADILSNLGCIYGGSEENARGYLNTLIAWDIPFEEAMLFTHTFNSLYCYQENNPAEGIVIRPWREHIYTGGESFVIKKKSEAFEEKPARLKIKEVIEYSEAQLAFKGYLNENRVLSVFSKHGQITSQKQLGDYIKLVIQDAKEDFFKDFPNVDKNDRDLFKLAGNAVVPLLRKYL